MFFINYKILCKVLFVVDDDFFMLSKKEAHRESRKNRNSRVVFLPTDVVSY